jgi:hypothetical protein
MVNMATLLMRKKKIPTAAKWKAERPQSQAECSGDKKNLLSMSEIESQIVQPTAYSPYQLSYYRSHQREKQNFIT